MIWTKRTFNLILTLAVMLTMAQTAWAATVKETTTETRTMTWPMNGTGVSGSELTNSAGNRLVLSKNSWQGNSTASKPYTQILNEDYGLVGTEITFPDIVGKVTSVELTNVLFAQGGMCLKAGINSSTLLSSTVFASYDDEEFKTYTSAFTFSGALDVTAAMPLKLMFMTANTAPEGQLCKFRQGSITVTYEVEVEVPDPEDPGHNFSFNVSGNTLTATCNQQSQYHNCGLTDGKATLTLSVEDCTSNGDFTYNPASTNLAEFNQQTGLQATKGDITYTNNTTGQTTTVASQVLDVGSYTASVTVTIGGNNYTLTKGFNILAGHKVNNNYSQFSVSKTSALEGDEITITYTQQMDEILEGLTLMGATSGNNITYTDNHDGTYTFTMPAEDVTINATITYPLNENNITQSGDIYTIKTAEGWNYFCRRMEVDGDLNGFSGKTVVLAGNITVTTSMAGSGKDPFKGTFDGDGHTLTFNHTASAPCSAPFQNTNGATIRNLHATGQIDGGIWNYIGGLVGSAEGNLTIENCRVSTQISSTVSGTAFNGGFVGLLSSHYDQCHITGCVFDGLIYNSEYSGTTYGCGGFVGCFSQYGYAILKDCLFIHGQYDNNNGKCELWWGNENDKNSTFLHRTNNQGEGKLTNCFYVGTRGLKQGSPAVESATPPANFDHFGTPTDHRFMKTYGHTMLFNGKYYTPTYGDLVEHYGYSGVKSYNIEYDDMPLGIPDITSQLWTESLTYNRTFTAGKPVTVMLPFNFKKSYITLAHSSENPTGKFYSFAGVNGSAPVMESGNEVTEMKANTPYLYVPGEDTEYWDVYYGGYGINIFTEGYGGGTKEVEYDGWTLKGTYDGEIWDADASDEYVLGDNGEVALATAGTMVNPTSAYVLRNFALYDLTLYDSGTDAESNGLAIATAAESSNRYNVTLSGRTLYKDGSWNTLCLPFAMTAEQVTAQLSPVKLMTLGTSSFSDGTLTLNFEDATTIEAGKPYIVKWTAGGANIENPIFTGVTVSTTMAPVVTASIDFIGTTSPVTLIGGDRTKLYLGDANTLYYPLTDVTINSCRAYFELKGGIEAGDKPNSVQTFVLNFGDETTGIVDADWNSVSQESGISNLLQQSWFTLDGRKLSDKPTTKGIYINNGRKVVIK